MAYQVTLSESAESFACRDDENVLAGMCRLGKKGIPSGCKGGGCGICKVAVLNGEYQARRMSSSHISEEDLQAGIVLACRIFPSSDLELEVIGPMKKNVLRCLP
ncbi:MAG: 2Fe-2S iron-sulfur cluster binding domain-containing protein [Neptuniibacter sp.]